MNPLFAEVDRLVEGFKSSDPELYKLSVPRRYVPPHGYANPRLYGCMMIAMTTLVKRVPYAASQHTSANGAQMEMMASVLMDMKVPTYFVTEEFARAVAATEPPDGMLINEIHYPLEAMLMCLPLAFMKEYCGRTVPFIAMAHLPVAKRKWGFGERAYTINNDQERIALHSPVYYTPVPVDFIKVAPVSDSITSMASQQPFVNYLRPEFDSHGERPPTKEEELALSGKINSLGLKLLLALSARPEMKEEAPMARPAKIKHGREEKEELWHPNMIGRTYRIVREPGYTPEGSHASPRMHWRRGHMRNQRHGRLLALKKLIWIDPVLVCASTEEAA